jgi:hypothetical protein
VCVYIYIYIYISKGKGKVPPRTGHESPVGEKRYSSALSLTSALDGAGGQSQALAALRVRIMLPPSGFDLRPVHPVASRHTD